MKYSRKYILQCIKNEIVVKFNDGIHASIVHYSLMQQSWQLVTYRQGRCPARAEHRVESLSLF